MGSIYYTKRLKNRNAPRRVKRQRPKTFKTQEAADKWAKENNVKKYSLENLRSLRSKEQKIRIVTK